MTQRVRLRWSAGEVAATLEDGEETQALVTALPLTAKASTWGEEVHFEVPVKAAVRSDAQKVVDPGSVCFCAQSGTLAIPFGMTMASEDEECRFEAPVNVIGKVEGDPGELIGVDEGVEVTIELA